MLHIFQPESPRDWRRAKALLGCYAQELQSRFGLSAIPEAPDNAYPPPGGFWLASRAGMALGCVALRQLSPREGELKRLFLRPRARGAGVGRALVETALGAARAAGFVRIRLDTLPGMDAAQALYETVGFRPTAPYGATRLPGARYFERLLDGEKVPTADGGP